MVASAVQSSPMPARCWCSVVVSITGLLLSSEQALSFPGCECSVNWRRVNATMIPTDVSESIRATSFEDMVDKYSRETYRSIIVGDLFNAYKVVPKQFWNFGDLPFARKEGCPDALAVSPHPQIVASAKAWVQKQFGGDPYLGIHWRSRDFGGLRICLQEEFSRACLTPEKVARCAAAVLKERGLKRMVLCSDGTAANVRCVLLPLSRRFVLAFMQ